MYTTEQQNAQPVNSHRDWDTRILGRRTYALYRTIECRST